MLPRLIFYGYHNFSQGINGGFEIMKISSRIYKGIEYVQLSDLPADQQQQVTLALEHTFIKILIDKSIISNCIQYRDYENWFEKAYPEVRSVAKVEKPEQQQVLA